MCYYLIFYVIPSTTLKAIKVKELKQIHCHTQKIKKYKENLETLF